MQDQSGDDDGSSDTKGADEQRKRAIARALKDFTRELKLIDVVDLIAYVQTDHHANISDLVKSSAELYFKQDTLRYGMAAEVVLDWDTKPTVGLDLEFYHQGVWVYFTLVLRDADSTINVSYIETANSQGDTEADNRRLIDALEDARTRPRF